MYVFSQSLFSKQLNETFKLVDVFVNPNLSCFEANIVTFRQLYHLFVHKLLKTILSLNLEEKGKTN